MKSINRKSHQAPINPMPHQGLFNHSHSITVLIAMFVLLALSAGFGPFQSQQIGSAQGLIACLFVFCVFGAVYLPDGPFKKPHPVLWRIVAALSFAYLLTLVFLLFQDVSEARRLCSVLDPNLNKPLPERNYGGNCIIYDGQNKPDDPFHNVKEKFDVFVIAHLFGWWVKALVIRDFNILSLLSIGFELLEYTLQTQLPNFEECWWDHWIMDFALCNAIGIFAGIKTCRFFVSPQSKRILGRFAPNDWLNFDWRPLTNIKRWLTVVFLIVCFLLQDLGTFYLKHILWIPPPHFYCLARLFIYSMAGGVAIRETFEYLDNKKCKRLGMQAWIMLSCLICEVLLVVKWDMPLLRIPINQSMLKIWMTVSIAWAIFTALYFGLLKMDKKKKTD